jgi:long-chain fatty acid transport protein
MKKAVFLLLALVCGTATVFAAGVDLTGVGVRSTSLGGNYRAVSNDWSGMFWNPAGLVFSKGLKAGASLEFITPSSGYTSAAALAGMRVSGTSSTEIKSKDQTFLMPAFGVYYSNEKMAYGLGFWAPFGLGSKWDLLNTSKYNSNYPEIEYEDDLKILALQPTFAYKLADNFSVGVGLTLLYADIAIRKPNFTPNPVTFTPSYAALKAALGASALPPFDHFLTEANLEGNGMGFGAAFGLQFKPMPTLTLGASAKWYNTIGLDGTLSADTYYAKDPGNVKPTLDQLLALNMITTAQYQQLAGAYSGAKATTIPKTDVKADLPLPLNIGAGFAFTGISKLLITGDVAMTQWSSWDVIEINDTKGNKMSELKEDWEDGIRMGLGLEYSLPLAEAKLRAAFYSEPNAAIAETMNPTIPDINRRNVVVFGFGFPFGPVQANLMYEHMFIGDKEVAWSPSTPPYENIGGLYTMKVHNFMLGLDWNF